MLYVLVAEFYEILCAVRLTSFARYHLPPDTFCHKIGLLVPLTYLFL